MTTDQAVAFVLAHLDLPDDAERHVRRFIEGTPRNERALLEMVEDVRDLFDLAATGEAAEATWDRISDTRSVDCADEPADVELLVSLGAQAFATLLPHPTQRKIASLITAEYSNHAARALKVDAVRKRVRQHWAEIQRRGYDAA